MTLPSTIPTKHGEYEHKPSTPYGGHYESNLRRATWNTLGGPLYIRWTFSGMTPDEIIEFLQAYKEATKVTER